MKRDRAFLAVLILILANFVFFSATLQRGQHWGGDFAMYIHEAQNIARGISYAQTGYIYNPAMPIAPKVYPPIFPLLLAPIYKIFGLNLTAMKLEILFFFELFLFLCWLNFKEELPPTLAVALIAVLGFNPFFWQFRNNIVSDIPFAFFAYLTLFSISQYYRSARMQNHTVLAAVLIGVSMYVCYGTRTVGLVFVPALLLYDWIKHKNLSKFAVLATMVCTFLIVLQSILLGATSSYLHMFTLSPRRVMYDTVAYAKSVSVLWENAYSKWPRAILFFGIYSLALTGFIKRCLRRPTLYEVFLVIYLGIVLLWPFYVGLLILIPVVPLYLFYAFFALSDGQSFWRPQWARSVGALLIILTAATYVGAYSRTNFGPVRTGIDQPETIALFQFVRKQTPARAIFIFRKPRVLSLFTGRRAAVYPVSSNDVVLWKYFQTIHASYLVTSPLDDPSFPRFIEACREDLERVYSNSDFAVYRILRQRRDLFNTEPVKVGAAATEHETSQ